MEFNQLLGLAVGRRKIDLSCAGAASGPHLRQLANHPMRLVYARFGFGGARFGTTPQPFDLRMDPVFERFLPVSLCVQMFFFGLQKSAVVSRDAQRPVLIG